MARILVVDDDPYIADLYREALQTAGHVVDVATEGLIALEYCAVCRYAIVVTDINMPGIDGVELQKMIHAQRPGMPIIYITSGGEMTPAVTRLWEVDALIKKQDGVEALVNRVHAILVRKGTDAGSSQTHDSV